MLNLKKSIRSLFTKEKMGAILSAPVMNGIQRAPASPSFRCYSSTKDISCHTFWTTILDGVLSRLIYEGELTDSQKDSPEVKAILHEAWNDILFEHAETISEDAATTQKEILDITKKDALINGVACIVLYLQKDYDEGLANWLRKKFKMAGVKLDISQPFQFQRDLERCIAVSKTWQYELTKQQDVINDRFNNKNKPQLSYKAFAKTLVPMSKFMGGKMLNAKELMVYDYDMIYSQMIEQTDKQ